MEGNHAVTWRTSSYSGNNGATCVEVGDAARTIAVRDSRDPRGPVLAFGPRTWHRFAAQVKGAAR